VSFASDTHQFTFIHVHRTGGTSVRALLRASVPDLRQIGDGHVPHTMIPAGDPSAAYYSFGVVRDPVDWLGSLYRYVGWPLAGHVDQPTVAAMTFSQFIRWLVDVGLPRGDGTYRRQADFLQGVSSVLPFPAIAVAIPFELAMFGVNVTIPLPRQLHTDPVPRHPVSRADVDFIYRQFAGDFDLYRHAVNKSMPLALRALRAVEPDLPPQQD